MNDLKTASPAGCLAVFLMLIFLPFELIFVYLGGQTQRAATLRQQPANALGCALILSGTIWAVALWIVVVLVIGEKSTLPIANEDRKAYDTLRDNGYSDSQAKDAASSIRRLCEAAHGRGCR
jgi:hypothetical protein